MEITFDEWAEYAISELKKDAVFKMRDRMFEVYRIGLPDITFFFLEITKSRLNSYNREKKYEYNEKDIPFLTLYSDRPGISVMMAAIFFYLLKKNGKATFLDLYDIIGDPIDNNLEILHIKVFEEIWDMQKHEGSNLLDDINFVTK